MCNEHAAFHKARAAYMAEEKVRLFKIIFKIKYVLVFHIALCMLRLRMSKMDELITNKFVITY